MLRSLSSPYGPYCALSNSKVTQKGSIGGRGRLERSAMVQFLRAGASGSSRGPVVPGTVLPVLKYLSCTQQTLVAIDSCCRGLFQKSKSQAAMQTACKIKSKHIIQFSIQFYKLDLDSHFLFIHIDKYILRLLVTHVYVHKNRVLPPMD